MIDVNDERTWLRIVWIKQGDDWRAEFVIDGREYVSSEAVQAAVQHTYEELERRRIPAEIECSPVSPIEPLRELPSSEEYWRQLARDDSGEAG
ncbi:MAG TPA: hypothetical protein VHU91_09995 [Mycobacteriales bacterium]|jgi:hypothetical protein|nr:hypothetical protein [Mycobacteriales bacterium]